MAAASFFRFWKNRAVVKITSPIATANFQHRLTLSWLPGMRRDFRDIRFSTISRINCPFWIESYTAGVSAVVWIKVPPASQTTLFLYYGHGGAPVASSGANTFDLFDDFLGTSLDTTLKWTLSLGSGGSLSVANSEAVLSTTGTANSSFYTKTSYGEGYAMRMRMKSAHYNSTGYRENVGWTDGSRMAKALFCDEAGGYQGKYRTRTTSDSLTSISGWSAATYYILESARNAASGVTWKVNDGSAVTCTTQYPNGYSQFLENLVCYNGGSMTFDWIAVRKCATTEPTLSIISHGRNPYVRVSSFIGTMAHTGVEYVWDPVNIDHGMSAGIAGQEIEAGSVNIDHAMAAVVGPTEIEMGPVNINHPIYPTATWDRILTNPTDDTGTLISVTVTRGMDDAMTQAEFQHDTDAIGNILSNDYMTKIVVKIPDYSGTNRVVFVGIAPSSRATYAPANDKMTLTAVDYGLYLTKQVLEDQDLALLPPAEQSPDSNTAKVLSYDYSTTPFQIGNRVIGKSSGATGKVIEIVQGLSWRITMYPASGQFIDNEDLLVGGVKFAQADGRSVDIPYEPYYSVTYPEDWVRAVLGGTNWMRVTGIEPYKIVSTSGYWDTALCPAVPFMFGSKDKKFDAIKRLGKYLRYIMLIKPRDIGGGNYVPALYFVPETSMDDPVNGLDLPAAATITGPSDPYLAAPITLEQNGESQVDLVRVACQDLNGVWLESKLQNSRVSAGEGPYREFYDEPQDIATQTDLDAYCQDIFNLYSSRGATWQATLVDRSDLELYQLLTITGYGTKIPDGTYRIIKISYEYGCAVNKVQISFMLASAFSTLLRIGRIYTDSITEIQRIVKHELDKIQDTELGTCVSNDGITVTYETESGSKGRGRDGTVI